MIKTVVFDIGRTLMEYKDMPNSWQEYYPAALENVREKLKLDITDEELGEALEIFRSYSPRLHYREVDYTPEHIFSDVARSWRCKFEMNDFIEAFFESMKLSAYIYPETEAALKSLKSDGIKIAALTDVATGMPDEMHKSYFPELTPYFDIYVSSVSCGYRKPNPKGLEEISAYLGTKPCETLMVGDEEKDIKVAKRFGCRAVLIDRAHEGLKYGQDYTVYDLNELEALIKRINTLKNAVIRPEAKDDYKKVYSVVKNAFQSAEHSDGCEQDLVETLRKGEAYIPELSLVAEINGRIIGHIMFTEAKAGDGVILCLAPLSVDPSYQRMGVGSALIKAGHDIAKKSGYKYSVVLGSTEYYPKFGYIRSDKLGIIAPQGISQEYLMAVKLDENAPEISGTVKYAKEFGI